MEGKGRSKIGVEDMVKELEGGLHRRRSLRTNFFPQSNGGKREEP